MLFYSLLFSTIKISYFRYQRLLCRYKYPKHVLPIKKMQIAQDVYTELFKLIIHSLNRKRFTFVNKRIASLIQLKTFEGFRHLFHLPVHGQRSKTNAQTQKKKGYVYKKDLKHSNKK